MSTVPTERKGAWKIVAEKLGRTVVGGLSVPITSFLLECASWLEIWRLSRVTNALAIPNISSARGRMDFVENQVLDPLTDPKNYEFDLKSSPDAPGNYVAPHLLLHAISSNLSLESERKNHNLFVFIPANIEYLQKQLDKLSSAILPTWAHTILSTLASGLGYASTSLRPILPGPFDVYDATMMEPYRFVPLLPFTLEALWVLGALTLANDISRLGAAAIISSQRFYAKNNNDVFTVMLESMLTQEEKIPINRQDEIIKAMVSGGLTKELAAYVEEARLSETSNHTRQIVIGLQNAIDDLPSSRKLYRDDLENHAVKITDATRKIIAPLRKAAREWRDVSNS